MPTRASALGVAALVALGAVFGLVPARGQQIHRHSFAGRQTVLVRGDANVRVEEKEHDISTQSFHSQPASEHVKLLAEPGTGDAAYIHYYYDTPPAPVSEVLTAGVWVKATKSGIQLRARVVFPKEPDPARPESRLTMLVVGDVYDQPRSWQKLGLGNVPELVGKHLPVIQAKIGRTVNTTDAYIDRLVLNLYSGPGPVDVWIDDLDIGPVTPPQNPGADTPGSPRPGVPTGQPKMGEPIARKPRMVEQRGGQLTVDGTPRFFRAIRHTGTPLHVLRAAGFDAVWLPSDAPPELIDEANREDWLLIPATPQLDVGTVGLGEKADRFASFLRKFGNSDVLFWDLGGGLTEDQAARVDLTATAIRDSDRRRPLGGDLWDGFSGYSQTLDVVGAHRWPLFTSLELAQYRDWLQQRRQLVGGSRCVFWTWIQNHLPDWYVSNILGRENADGFADPIGPHPEQVRLLTYVSIAAGCRGLGFWSDRFLADSHQGRDRLQGMALLNTELDMLAPVLLSASATGNKPLWINTSNGNVKAAVIRGEKGLILLPIWLGGGSQYVPPQGAVQGLTITVPLVPDGADPWLITPAGVTCLRELGKKVAAGLELTIPEFDLVSPIVFTSDLTPNGMVVWWQDHCRKYGRLAARWALDMAAAEYEKVRLTHVKLTEMGVQVRGADTLLRETHRYYQEAQKNFAAELYDKAYLDATRALRPLRLLMRDHWQQAVATLDVPTASPYAVSFFSLPKHWELYRELQNSQVGQTLLPHGGFELRGEIPEAGVPVQILPGWTARAGSLEADRVQIAAGIVPAAKLADTIPPREPKKQPKTVFSPSRAIHSPDEGYVPPAPELGTGVLKLEMRPKTILDRDGKPLSVSPVLERAFLAVDSPPVKLPPGTLVRVSGWVKIPRDREITASVDGALLYDDVGGEPLGVRLTNTRGERDMAVWKQFHLYRRVPATGQISVTLALTGLGVAYFDDVRIEPLTPDATAKRFPNGGGSVVPVGYRKPPGK